MKQRIYIDTSIIGGYFDVEFELATRELFKRLEKNEILFVLSDLLFLELLDAPIHVKTLLDRYPQNCFEKIEISEESIQLANWHIAMASINKVDVLASWNFKHIVNLQRIKGYNSVNLKYGYSLLEIRSPNDLLNYGN